MIASLGERARSTFGGFLAWPGLFAMGSGFGELRGCSATGARRPSLQCMSERVREQLHLAPLFVLLLLTLLCGVCGVRPSNLFSQGAGLGRGGTGAGSAGGTAAGVAAGASHRRGSVCDLGAMPAMQLV